MPNTDHCSLIRCMEKYRLHKKTASAGGLLHAALAWPGAWVPRPWLSSSGVLEAGPCPSRENLLGGGLHGEDVAQRDGGDVGIVAYLPFQPPGDGIDLEHRQLH